MVSPDEREILSSLRSMYDAAFPTDERRIFDSVVELVRSDPDFNLYAIVKDNEPVGLFSEWQLGGFVFVEHFAVADKHRGMGVGQRILGQWLQEQSLPIVLEVERPEDEITNRRVALYERAGFRHWPVDYVQPAYAIDKNPVPMHLMTYGDINLDEVLEEVRQKIYQKVYPGTLLL